ncbi:hypothetical protein [Cyclobacterium qasimii]|nr:hypothetical protein [Cyclobacterium qasimii]
MNKAVSILMIAVMLLPGFTKIGILIDFKINQDFIAEVLCINKDEPMTMCNGKCFLSEQLKKAEEKEEKQAPGSKDDRMSIVYYQSKRLFNFLSFNDKYFSKLKGGYQNKFFKASFVTDIYKPPKLNLI